MAATHTMLILARVLFWMGLLCFVPFLFPMIENKSIPNGTEDRFTLGLPQSPWLLYSSSKTTVETKMEGKERQSSSSSMSLSTRFGVEFLAWSWLFAIAGMVLIALGGRLKTRTKPSG
jgi:hypothetical protein